MENQSIAPFGYQIASDKEGRLSMTDLWKAAGSIPNKDPRQWRKKAGRDFIETAIQILNVPEKHIIKSEKGKGGGTYAHRQIALAYAKYLSPELHVFVNNVFFERLDEEKNPQLAIDRAVKSWERQGKSEKWIQERLSGKATRTHFTKTLGAHGVNGKGYGDCTNAIYTPLWGGGANVVRSKKGLPQKSNTREAMSEIELAGVRLAELLASDNIEKHNINGNEDCAKECRRSSSLIAGAITKSRQNFLPNNM